MQSGCLGRGSVPIGDGLDACQEIEGLLILPLAGCSALVQLVPRLTAGCSALLPAPSLGPPCPEHIGHHASALYIGTTRSHNNATSHSRAQESCLEARQPKTNSHAFLKDSSLSPICLNKPGTYLNILDQQPEDYR